MQERIGKTEKKKRNTQENLDNVTQGRKTLKTLLKNNNDAGTMVNKIENVSTLLIPYPIVVRQRN